MRGLRETLELRPEVHAHVYRIVQEALHNTYKHAQAATVSVALESSDAEAVVTVRDDGVGFDVPEVSGPSSHGGLGLVGMRERATLFGGHVFIESAPGQGTVVTIHIPLTASLLSS